MWSSNLATQPPGSGDLSAMVAAAMATQDYRDSWMVHSALN